MIQKRFPANTTLDYDTFLNDSSIDGELYAYYQSISTPELQEDGSYLTKIYKKDLPNQKFLCDKIIKVVSPKTLRARRQKLIDRGYLEILDNGDYILPPIEEIYFMIPLDTLRYLTNNCRKHVIKLYIYLGQRYKFGLNKGENYEFSSEELGKHIGIQVKNKSDGYKIVNDALDLLYNSGLIDYCSFFDGQSQKKKLLSFNLEHKKNEK